MKQELILIKLGGSVITDKSKEFTAREGNIKRFAQEIKDGQKAFSGKIIIGHGAGSFAHTPAAKFQTKKGIINNKSFLGAAIVEDAARALDAILIRNFVYKKLPVFPFSPASFLLSDRQIYSKSYLDPIKNALRIGAIPIVYGDVVMDKKQGFTIFSTEKVLAVLAKELKDFYQIRMIYVTDVDGVYDKNGKTIPVITEMNNQLKASIVGARNVDVTGGMFHKVEESLRLKGEFGIETLIISGTKPGNLRKVLIGKEVPGTRIQSP